jgi:hypothetical protein
MSLVPTERRWHEPPTTVGRNEEVNFRGEMRSNQTHVSTNDPDAMLYRKGSGMGAKLCYIGHTLMENRNGLLVDAGLRKTEYRGLEKVRRASLLQQRPTT